MDLIKEIKALAEENGAEWVGPTHGGRHDRYSIVHPIRGTHPVVVVLHRETKSGLATATIRKAEKFLS